MKVEASPKTQRMTTGQRAKGPDTPVRGRHFQSLSQSPESFRGLLRSGTIIKTHSFFAALAGLASVLAGAALLSLEDFSAGLESAEEGASFLAAAL